MPNEIKDYLLGLWQKYAKKYQLKFLDFNILDNHAHAMLFVTSVALLGEFMRTVNCQLARRINEYHKRDSHALRERYKSALITTTTHMLNGLGYIWLNRWVIDNQGLPQDYRYCSLYYRWRGIAHPLLSSYEEFGIVGSHQDEKTFVRRHLEIVIKMHRDGKLSKKVYNHPHTIGPDSIVAARRAIIRDAMAEMRFAKREGFT